MNPLRPMLRAGAVDAAAASHLLRIAVALVVRDWRVRFRRTLLGMAWLCVPLLGLAALALSAGAATGLYEPGQAPHYLSRLMAGLVLWQLFADAWLEPMRLSRRAGPLLRAFSFDARALLLAGALSALAALAVRAPLVVAAWWWFGIAPGPGAWAVAPGLLLLVAAGATLACFTLPAGLVLHDLRYGMPYAQWALLAACPIFYERPAQGVLAKVVDLNPLSALVPPVRDLLLGTQAGPSAATPLALAIAAAVVLPLLVLGLAYYGTRIRLAAAYVGH